MKKVIEFQSGRFIIFSYNCTREIDDFEYGNKLFEVYYFTKTFESEDKVSQIFKNSNDLLIYEIKRIVFNNKEFYNYFDIDFKLVGNSISTKMFENYNTSYCFEFGKFIQLKLKK